MTITEIEQVAVATPSPEAMAPAVYQRLPQNILANGVSSGDHKVIGRLWIIGSLLFGLFTLVADVLVRIERVDTDSVALFSNRFAFEQWFSLHRVSLVFLFVVPLLIGIAMVMVPLQIGSPSLAFPRAAAAALWSWAVAGVIMVVSWAIDGGLVDRGTATVSKASQLSMISLAAVVLSIVIASLVIVTTIFTERSQGMSLYNVPLFTWSMLVAAGIWLLSLPVLISNLMVMWVDSRGEAAQSFGNTQLYDQISWVFDQPQVFAFAIPVLGLLGETLPVALRRRLKSYDLAMVAIGAFGAFSFGAYAQTFFNPNADTTWLYVVGSIILILPILVFLGACAQTATAADRAPVFSAQLALSAMAVVALLTAGALAAVRVFDSLLAPVIGFLNDIVGFFQGSGSGSGDGWEFLSDFEGWLRDTFDEIAGTSVAGAMVQLALVAGLIAAVAALFYWAPKIFGRRLSTGLGLLAGLALLGGALLSALPDAISGFLDQPEFVAAYDARDGVELLNLISLIGSIGVFAGLGLVLLALPAALVLGGDAEDEEIDERNPVGGHTLEWLTESPPPPGNFPGPYVVTSEAPLLDEDFENPYAEGASA
jgi:heme/copper-type cytochrome/quinol oxidase subunit 1